MFHRLFRPRIDDARDQTIWLTVYADLMTNLFLLFLALFGLIVMGGDAMSTAEDSMKMDVNIDEIDFEKELDLRDVAGVLREEFNESIDISIREEAMATRMGFGENVLFQSGSAILKPTARPVLLNLANLLRLVPYTIVVEGHTDDVSLRPGSEYKNNWELSLARAMAVVRVLADEGGISEDQLAAAAYGYFHPVSSNLTRAGRHLNRRVEVALFKDFPYEL